MSRTVVVKNASVLRQTVVIGSHHFLADEAKDVGGTDEGPDPYKYLLAALGTCTNMTVRTYANRKTMAAARSTDHLVSREKPHC